MMRAVSRVVALVCIGLMACIDPIDLQLDGDEDRLVVDGLISDEVGPYTVTLSRSLAFDNSGLATSYLKAERNAIVTISSDAGEKVLLKEISPGVYQTDTLAIRGQLNRSYRVEIKTTDGNTYHSVPEKLLPTPAIQEIVPSFVSIPKKSSSGNDVLAYGFQISVVTNDPAGENNYYRWKSTGIIEYHSITDNPYIQTCWYGVPQLETKLVVSDDRLTDGSRFTQPVGLAPYERPTRFQARVRQYSLTPEAFEFWRIIAEQQEATGSIFDPPPAQVVGNLVNENNSDDIPLGYFGASSVSEISLVFNRHAVSEFFVPPNNVPMEEGDCRLHVFNSTNVRPEGF